MIFAGIKKQEELNELIEYFEIEGGVDAGQRLHTDEDG
jgi:cytochrome c2